MFFKNSWNLYSNPGRLELETTALSTVPIQLSQYCPKRCQKSELSSLHNNNPHSRIGTTSATLMFLVIFSFSNLNLLPLLILCHIMIFQHLKQCLLTAKPQVSLTAPIATTMCVFHWLFWIIFWMQLPKLNN